MKKFKMARVILAILALAGFTAVQATAGMSALVENSASNWSEQQVEKVAQDLVLIDLLTPSEMKDWKKYIDANNGNVTLPQSDLNEKDFKELTQYMQSTTFTTSIQKRIQAQEKNMSASVANLYIKDLEEHGEEIENSKVATAAYTWQDDVFASGKNFVTRKMKEKIDKEKKEIKDLALKEIKNSPKTIVTGIGALVQGSKKK